MGLKRLDSFGNAQIGPGPAFQGRLIQTGATTFALFPAKDDIMPTTLTFEATPVIKGRMLKGTLVAEGPTEFVFQRASCGCQTPNHLRGPSRKLLETIATESIGA